MSHSLFRVVRKLTVLGCFLTSLAPAFASSKVLPVLNQPIADQHGLAGVLISVDLTFAFGTEPIDDQVVRFASSNFKIGGVPVFFDMALFSNRTPVTRQNFLKYVTDGDYVDSFIHRSVPGFVIQGGAFRRSGNDVDNVPTDPTIVNEFGVSNTLGTISMAKVGGNPDSATSQWFVSLGANSDILDSQNGGFTVFGQVTRSTLGIAQTFGSPSSFPIYDYRATWGSAFGEWPLWHEHVPPNIQFSQLILFTNVELVDLPPGEAGESPTLTYSLVSNSNPEIATVSVQSNGMLSSAPVEGRTGSTTVTVQATDSVGNTVNDTFNMTFNESFETWAETKSFPDGQSSAGQNPDGDAWTNLQEFAFFGDPLTPDHANVTTTTDGVFPSSHLTITFPVRKFTPTLTYTVEANDGLTGSWTEIWKLSDGFSHSQVVSAVDQADRTVTTIKDTADLGTHPKRFLRLRVEISPEP